MNIGYRINKSGMYLLIKYRVVSPLDADSVRFASATIREYGE